MAKRKGRLTERQQRERAAEAVADLLQQQLDEVEAEQEGKRVPGMVVRGSKTGWTEKDLLETYGGQELTPDVTIPVTISGVRFQLIQGVSMYVPKEVIRVFEESKRRTRDAGKGLVPDGYIIEAEAGALAPQL